VILAPDPKWSIVLFDWFAANIGELIIKGMASSMTAKCSNLNINKMIDGASYAGKKANMSYFLKI
jgi:hypothetical protein